MIRLLALLALTPSLAWASNNCAQRDHVIQKLQDSYSEELRFGGLQKTRAGQSVMEVWASPETNSFTVLVTHANGISCIVAVGTDFFEANPKATLPGDPL